MNNSTDIIIEIPDCMPLGGNGYDYKDFNIDRMLEKYKLRDEWISKGMFAFVSWKWVIPFVSWIGNRKCLEVMGGCGWLSKALREKNVDVICTDDFSWHQKDHWKNKWCTVTEVEKLPAHESVIKYGKDIDILIMSWPYMDSDAFNTLFLLHTINPKALVVYIGEDEGGCTADTFFFNHFKEIDDNKFYVAARNFEQWYSIHDELKLGRYDNNLDRRTTN